MKEDDRKANLNIAKMKALEKHEQALMDRLKNTLNIQQQAFKDFETMVLSKDRINKS